MSEYVLMYMVIGLSVNVGTMANEGIKECFFEWGLVGFVFQLLLSAAVFPLILFYIVRGDL